MQRKCRHCEPRARNPVAIPLRGYVVCNPAPIGPSRSATPGRNPLTGLCGLQPFPSRPPGTPPRPAVAIPLRGYVVCNHRLAPRRVSLLGLRVAIPLRGYVVCNQGDQAHGREAQGRLVAIPLRGYVVCNALRRWSDMPIALAGRNPLTGLCGLQLQAPDLTEGAHEPPSQSPYGAMWFATKKWRVHNDPWEVAIPLRGYVVCNKCPREGATRERTPCRNPLTGLCGLQRELRGLLQPHFRLPVAIPLRGYVVCNSHRLPPAVPGGPRLQSQSPYGAMWFATHAHTR